MRHDELATQRILNQCSGLHAWLSGTAEREPARDRLQRVLGDRLLDAVVGSPSPRR